MKRSFSNSELASLFSEVGAVLRAKEKSPFRAAAYEKAAVALEHSPSDVKDLWDDRCLGSLPGLGRKFQGYLDELFRTGKVTHFVKIKKSVFPAFFELLKIPGIGGKTALVLTTQLQIKQAATAITRLEHACSSGQVRKLENFATRSEQEILEGIKSFRRGERKTKRMLLWEADQQVSPLLKYLRASFLVIQAESLGSVRRRVPTIGDLDIAASSDNPIGVIKHFSQHPAVKRVLSAGETAASVVLTNGREVNLRVSSPVNYGSMLQYFTGGKFHNIKLRNFALKKGLSLSEYGVKDQRHAQGKTKNFSQEKDFYQELGLPWIPPELREDQGEIEAAIKGKLPLLVREEDIQGDLHLHSNFALEVSHDVGSATFAAMIAKGRQRGYRYLAFTEHNPAVAGHTENRIIDLIKQKKEAIDQINYSSEQVVKPDNKSRSIHVFNSLEVDIKPNGELALPEKALALLDFIVVAVHSSFSLSRDKMTRRVLAGLAHPKARILAHPTGRILNEREGYELDWEKVLAYCLQNNKYLEISAWPNRLDLPEALARKASESGVKLVISTDAHAVDQMDFITYGVAVAKRGWAQKKDVLNALPWEKINAILTR